MYNLHLLGWSGFQQLCLTIIREVLGQSVESYLDSNDGGRDGAFAGKWNANGGEELAGQFVIQCKFTSKNNYRLRPSDLVDELGKIRSLTSRGICDAYILMTNAGLSGRIADKIRSQLVSVGVKAVLLLGSTWIEQQIRENARLRMLVPRIYGLGDLTQILDERAYTQARAILDLLREDLAKVVVTDTYRNAAAALDAHGFVLLVGEPAAGKTTIAALLAMAAVDQWHAALLKLDNPDKVVAHWNPEEPSQFFWLDDAFGVTQYERYLAHGWNHSFAQVASIIRRGGKIVMTSRDYIYNMARSDLKESAFPLLNESQVVVDVHGLSTEERRQILYNHLKLGRQPNAFLRQIKPYLEDVADLPSFVPESARRLADPIFTKTLCLSKPGLTSFVNNREQFAHEVISNLDRHSKAALALIYMRKDRLDSPIELRTSELRAIERLGSTEGLCIAALQPLQGSLVLHSQNDGESFWRFKHPTIGDAYAAILAKSPELLGIFIQGSSPERLVNQISCGDVGIENAVIIPKGLFPLVIRVLGVRSAKNRNESVASIGGLASAEVHRFLSTRCSLEFLSAYLEAHPELLDSIARPGLYLDCVSEVGVAVRLHQVGLLPDDKRQTFVETVSEYALSGEDLHALGHTGIQSMFHECEFNDLLEKVKNELLPRLGDARREMQFNYSTGDPEAHMQPFLEGLRILSKRFGRDPRIAECIEREERQTMEWISEEEAEVPYRAPRTLGQIERIERPQGLRSLFDDLDEVNRY